MPETDTIPVSASIASTGLGIRYIGKEHCYAFSGTFQASNSEQTLFNFTTGSGYIVATLTMTAPVDMATIAGGYNRGYQLEFNSQVVGLYKMDAGPETMPTEAEVQILIPPFTVVVLTCIDTGNSADHLGTANITGRVYGAV